MLFVFTGSDYKKSSHEAQALIAGLQKKQPDAELVRMQPHTADQLERDLLSLANDQGLFFTKSLVSIQRLFPDNEMEAIMTKILPSLQQSPSIFVWTEPDLGAVWIKKLAQNEVVVKEFGAKTKADKPNMFSVSEALLNFDQKKLWLKIKEAQGEGVSAENVFGILFWQLKTLVLAKTYPDPESAGLKRYSYQKARQAKWGLEQINLALQDLVKAQIQARTAGSLTNLWWELEAWSLSLNEL